MVEYVYIVHGGNYDFEEILYASLDKGKRDKVFETMEKMEAFEYGIASEEVPLDHYRETAFSDWKKAEDLG